MCLALFRGAIQRSCDFSAIVSRLFSPSLSPRLVKSRCASAAPAASESLLRSGEALSPKNQNTHAHTHTVSEQCRTASSDRRGPFKNDNNSAHDCNSVFKGSFSINSLTLLSWICTAAPLAKHLGSHYSASLRSIIAFWLQHATIHALFYSKCDFFFFFFAAFKRAHIFDYNSTDKVS